MKFRCIQSRFNSLIDTRSLFTKKQKCIKIIEFLKKDKFQDV